MGGEGGGVGAGMGGEGEEGVGPLRGPLLLFVLVSAIDVICSSAWEGGNIYDLDGSVPRARTEGIFCDEVPMNGKDFSLMLLP